MASSPAGRAGSSAAGSAPSEAAGGPGMSGISGALTAVRLPSAASPAPAAAGAVVCAAGASSAVVSGAPGRVGAGACGSGSPKMAPARVSQASYMPSQPARGALVEVRLAGAADAQLVVGVADAQPRRVHGVQGLADAGAHGGALDRVGVGGLRVVAGADVLERRVGDLEPAAVVEGVVGLDLALVGEADRRQRAVGVAAREPHLERQRVWSAPASAPGKSRFRRATTVRASM